MTIPPALTKEEWHDQHYASDDLTITRHRVGMAGNRRLQVTVNASPLDSESDFVALIALANAALLDDDRRKITIHWVLWLREEADVLRRNGARAGALMADEIADALASYLPPPHSEGDAR